MKIRAVLFDYDGVTVDTPRLNHAAWAHAFAVYGVQIEPEEYFWLEGHGPRNIAKILCEKHGLDANLAKSLQDAKEAQMGAAGTPVVYNEIPSLLAILESKEICLGLVTGASRRRIESNLPEELRVRYKSIITSDDVHHTKPHPEPYLKAAAELGVQPAEALVVENAPLGVTSALVGGFRCVALTTTLPLAAVSKAHVVFPNHKELGVWIREHCV